MTSVTRVGRTNLGWLAVEVDFGDHYNDFLFPDTEDRDVIRYTILNWRERHPELVGDHHGANNIVTELLDHELLGEL